MGITSFGFVSILVSIFTSFGFVISSLRDLSSSSEACFFSVSFP